MPDTQGIEEIANDQVGILRGLIASRGDVVGIAEGTPNISDGGLVYLTLADGAQVGVLPETLVLMEDEPVNWAQSVFGTEIPTWFTSVIGVSNQDGEPVPAPVITVSPNAMSNVNTQTRRWNLARRVSNSVSINYPSTLGSERFDAAAVVSSGTEFVTALGILGVNVPREMRTVFGTALLSVTNVLSDSCQRYHRSYMQARDSLSSVEQTRLEQADAFKEQVRRLKNKNARLKSLEEAALAWRDTGKSDTERFEAFTAMMAAVEEMNPTPEPEVQVVPMRTFDEATNRLVEVQP